jgi:membrane protein insertase Oxa1/YidC/SpoIIIJ
MLEVGGDGIQMQNQAQFKWGMRALAVLMVPMTMALPQGLFVYWAANNSLSILQATVMKNEAVGRMLDIPKPPKPEDTPLFKLRKSPFATLAEVLFIFILFLFILFI